MAKNGDILGEVRLPISASLIAIVIVAALSVVYWFATYSLSQLVIFIAAVAAGVGATLGAFYASRGLQLTAAALEKEEIRLSKALAFQFTSKWNDPAMFHVRDVVRELFAIDTQKPEFLACLRQKETNAIHFLNFLEEVSIAIEYGGADATILEEAFGGVVGTAWSKLHPWVMEFRQTRQNTKIWIKVEALAKAWA